jgi:leader peptidase (prepilin peptidase)/N-methyltransferase
MPVVRPQIGALENVPSFPGSRCRASARPAARDLVALSAGRGPGRALALPRCGASAPRGRGAPRACSCGRSLALTFIDFDTQLLPDDLTLPLLWAASSPTVRAVRAAQDGRDRRDRGLPVAVDVYWLFKLIRGKEGMGYGDFKLLAALGAWLGWQMLPLIVLLSSIVGAAIGLMLIVFKGRDHSVPLASAPTSRSPARSRCSSGRRSSRCICR